MLDIQNKLCYTITTIKKGMKTDGDYQKLLPDT